MPLALDLSMLLTFARDAGGSDLVLSAGSPCMVRVRGEMRKLQAPNGPEVPIFGAEQVRALLYGLLTDEQKRVLETERDLDFGLAIGNVARFRGNAFHQEHGLAAVFRVIPTTIPTWEHLGLPDTLLPLAQLKRGLVIFTGPTGSGKSTSLAALVDVINTTRRGHIITIEDPIEFLHPSKLCVVNQRAVGGHVRSFAAALRSALREAPDVIMVGEMRDHETISLALTASETGHLVLGTLHTSSAPKTIDRLIGVFPPDEQGQVRAALAECLQAVVAQILVPKKAGGRVAALEILAATTGVRAMIRDGKTHELLSAIQTGAQYGMQSLEQDLTKLSVAGVIDKSVAAAELAAVGLGREASTERSQRAPVWVQGATPREGTAPGKPGDARNPKYRYQ